MASTLSQADVSKLLHEPSAKVRSELTSKLALELDNPKLNDTELNLAQDIVRLMAADVEASVRQALAQNLRKAARMPHDVVLKLANDIENVALPILQHCDGLTDDDLAAIVGNSNAPAKHMAIAARINVSERVSDALIEKAGEKAVAALMSNTTARIAETSLNKATDRFKESDLVKEKMVQRETLPPAIAERLVTMVSEQLRDHLVRHHELPPDVATDLIMQTRERSIIGLSSQSNDAEIEKMVAQMYRNQRLTPSLVLRSLCMGDTGFFEMAMAVMANVPVTNARLLIHDAGRLGLKSLYAKTPMPPRLLPAIRIAIDVIKETPMDGSPGDRSRHQARVIERVLTQYEDMGQDDLNYLIDKLGDMVSAAA